MRMTLPHPAVPPAVLLGAFLLSGCFGGLLGGGKPSQMYRFGVAASPVPDGPAPGATRVVQLAPVTFAGEIDTERLLATRGAEAFYLKGARWVSPTSELFAAALRDAVRRRAPMIALVDRADGDTPVLAVTVTRFEAYYQDAGKDAVPTIRIEGVATLTDQRGAGAARRYALAADQPAASGRIDDVVAAFDAADARVVEAVAAWVSASPGGS